MTDLKARVSIALTMRMGYDSAYTQLPPEYIPVIAIPNATPIEMQSIIKELSERETKFEFLCERLMSAVKYYSEIEKQLKAHKCLESIEMVLKELGLE